MSVNQDKKEPWQINIKNNRYNTMKSKCTEKRDRRTIENLLKLWKIMGCTDIKSKT